MNFQKEIVDFDEEHNRKEHSCYFEEFEHQQNNFCETYNEEDYDCECFFNYDTSDLDR